LPDPVATMRATQRAEALGVARKRFIDGMEWNATTFFFKLTTTYKS